MRSSGEGEIEVSAASAGEAEVKAGKIFVGRVVLRSFGRVGRIMVLVDGSEAEAQD
ncbi:MAG: hypothetical protein LZ170_06300 [Thaumarchaeota archaeon]|nr:hypothetical protein [Candidatus Terraquivivens yellowstonensis]